MNKTYQYTLTAHEKKEISFETGVARLAIANGDGVDGSTIVVMDEITKQHSGDLVSFIDGADAPFADFNVGIVAVQSGTGDPSPTNVRPISGWTSANVSRTGKNLVDIADRTITSQYTSEFFTLKKGTYTISLFVKNNTTIAGTCYLRKRDNTNVALIGINASINSRISASFTLTDDTDLRLVISGSLSEYSYDISQVQIEIGSTATTYEPYNGNTYNITWQSTAGTVYYGTYNLTTGVLIGTHTITQLLSSMLWNYSELNDRHRIFTVIHGMKADSTEVYSEVFKGANSLDVYPDKWKARTNTTPSIIIGVPNDFSLQDWKDLLDSETIHLVYPLATPVTYQLTPTEIRSLLGLNEVWADCGPVDVRYFVQSTQPMIDYIDEKTIVYFDAQEDFSTYDISLIGATSTDVKNCLKTNKNANIVIRVKRYSTIELFYLREYSPNYFADFASHAVIFDAEGTKSMRIDYLRLDLTQETTDFTDDYIILPTA